MGNMSISRKVSFCLPPLRYITAKGLVYHRNWVLSDNILQAIIKPGQHKGATDNHPHQSDLELQYASYIASFRT